MIIEETIYNGKAIRVGDTVRIVRASYGPRGWQKDETFVVTAITEYVYGTFIYKNEKENAWVGNVERVVAEPAQVAQK